LRGLAALSGVSLVLLLCLAAVAPWLPSTGFVDALLRGLA
jgi:hypothetical protein